MNLVPLIELTRGGTPECLHFGAVAVVNTRGQVVAQAGDPHWLTFSRSTLKALQALPFMQADGPRQFGFSQEQLALLCASHNGEDQHVAVAQGMLDKAGLTYKALRCGCHVPGRFALLDTAPPPDLVFDERHNNCSGKHAGFLAYCVQHGLTLEDYTDPMHPLQQAIRADVARAVGMDADDLKMGIDGCSAPNYALPLSRLAYGYARLASGLNDGEFGESFATLSEAMTAHPDLVSGTGRNDLAFMQAGRGDWVSKVGADGVQVLGSRARGEAFAIKIIDGNKPALFAASVEVLDQLGWLDDTQRAALAPWRAQALVNARGLRVGERKPVFKLQTP
ncbi:MAG: asparaginase [Rhodoferax sp.]|uniref:asparaginase n=1 Tax=Rhodoferax sp. TaxID=50421 RepID=UPI00271BDB94|nr:asparaginase [Rhodoferax sp.]MDO8449596.1 asparaginase [Rhodoferax sp.]